MSQVGYLATAFGVTFAVLIGWAAILAAKLVRLHRDAERIRVREDGGDG
jgi:hypothetical protein